MGCSLKRNVQPPSLASAHVELLSNHLLVTFCINVHPASKEFGSSNENAHNWPIFRASPSVTIPQANPIIIAHVYIKAAVT